VFRQAVDCSALEKPTFGLLGKDLCIVDLFSSRDIGSRTTCVSRVAGGEVFFFFFISKRNIIKKRKAQSSTQEVYKKGI
jgi:hypothetical protein